MSSQFEIDHTKLLEKISQSLDLLIGNLNELNRNLEIVNSIGKEFEGPANVWHQFHKEQPWTK
ncbi:unnamed protein product [Cunninghamella blakesleeana]